MTPSSLKKGYKPGSWNKLRRRKYNKIRAYVFEYKSKTPCKDCGKIFHPFVMDFDHIGDDKKFNISKTIRTWTSLFNEISKCELVCANCHRMRTLNRRGLQAAERLELDPQMSLNL